MHRPSARALAGAAAVTAAVLAAQTAPAVAAPPSRSSTYTLPGTGVFPEGVDTYGRYYYVTSTATGAVFRGDLDGRAAEVFLPGQPGGRSTAVGIEATADLLIVAGGSTGTVFVYDRQTGEELARHATGPATTATFVNDIAVTADGDVYVTDSAADAVYRIPAEDVRDDTRLVPFATFDQDPRGGFNANGIVAVPGGKYLVVVQSDTGRLYRVATDDGSVRQVDLGGVALTAGDGLELQGRTLYVVRNSLGRIAEVRLDGQARSGRLVEETTDPTFRFPTTAALDRGRLLVVNSQFDRRGGSPVEPFTVSVVRRP